MKIPPAFVCILSIALLTGSIPVMGQWQKLPSMPEPNSGFACGVEGTDILVMGGTHWKDGVKQWLRTMRRFDLQTLHWEMVGQFEESLAYATCSSLSEPGGMVTVGGSNGKAPSQMIWMIKKGGTAILPIPTLPRQIVLSAGGIISDSFIVAGGTDDAANIAGFTRSVFALNLGSYAVAPMPEYPGKPFGMAAAAVVEGELFVFGGANPVQPSGGIANSADANAFSYAMKRWRKLKSYPMAARGAAAVALDDHQIYLAGGFGGMPEGFLSSAFIYDTHSDSYAQAAPIPFAATASLVRAAGFVYCIGGEDNPRSRTDAFWRISVNDLVRPKD